MSKVNVCRFFRIASLVALATFLEAAETVPNRYILLLQDGQTTGRAAQSERAAAVRPLQQLVRAAVEAQSAEVQRTFSNVMNGLVVRTADGSDAGLDKLRLAAIPGVVRVYPVKLRKRFLNAALPVHAVQDAWQSVGGMDRAGAGVKIGIIDTGIDTTHPALKDSTLSIPAGFPKWNSNLDSIYVTPKVIVVRSYTDSGITTPVDVIGHGTAVAMVAAGAQVSTSSGVISGVAPKAWLGSYKVFPDPNSGAPDDLILQALDDAATDGMDIVNLSLGSDLADPELDPLMVAVENAVARGMIVTIAAGNAGPDPNTVGTPALSPSAIAVGNMANGHVFSGALTVGGSTYPGIPGYPKATNGSVSGTLKDVADLDPTGLACSSFASGSLTGRAVLILRGTCTFEVKLNNAQAAGATLAIVYANEFAPDAFEMAVGNATLPAAMVSYSDGLVLKGLAPSSPPAVMNFATQEVSQSSSRISSTSSRGPGIDNSLKPDLLAVGSSLVTAQSGGGYETISGSSFSAPMVAGAAAVLKANRPNLRPEQYKSLLVNSTRPMYLSGLTPASNTDGGAGPLHLLAALKAGATVFPSSLSFGIGDRTAQLSTTFTITNVEGQEDTFTLEPVALTGPAPSLSQTSVKLAAGSSTTLTATWKGNTDLAAGAYQGYIRLMADKALALQRIPYWYGVPSNQVSHISFLDAPESVPQSGTVELCFRLTDAAGIPVTTATPTVTVGTLGASVSPIVGCKVYDTSAALPGTFLLEGRAGRSDTTFTITAGGVTQTLVVPVVPVQ